MNKRRVDKWTTSALAALNSESCGIREQGTRSIPKAYRAQISSFGSAVVTGSFKMAVLVFSQAQESRHHDDVDRSKLLSAMYYIVNYNSADGADNERNWKSPAQIAEEIVSINNAQQLARTRAAYLDASIALKNAMNAFDLKE